VPPLDLLRVLPAAVAGDSEGIDPELTIDGRFGPGAVETLKFPEPGACPKLTPIVA
jgi:hypothetical protein